MAKVLKYPINKRISPHLNVKTIFATTAGRLEEDDEWMPPELFKELGAMLPENIGIDDDLPAWYDKPELNLVLHGYDEKQISDYNEVGLAYTSFFFDLKRGLVTRVETEGTD